MSLVSAFRSLSLQKSLTLPIQYTTQVRNASATGGISTFKKASKKNVMKKVVLPVETDVSKLLSHVCGSNIYKEGEDIKIKPDSEYPDWLWEIKTAPVPLEELDPNTKQYWRRLRKAGLRMNNRKQAQKKF